MSLLSPLIIQSVEPFLSFAVDPETFAALAFSGEHPLSVLLTILPTTLVDAAISSYNFAMAMPLVVLKLPCVNLAIRPL